MKDGRFGLIIVTLMTCAIIGCRPERPPTGSTPVDANATNQAKQNNSGSLPMSWNDVATAYNGITDYVCIYEKQERSISSGAVQKIRLSFRKPFDVRMEWLDNQDRVDQIAVYRQGFNDGKVLVREGGLLGRLSGTLALDPNGSLALSDSHHPITEVGIGKIIERAQSDIGSKDITSHFNGEDSLDGKPAYKVEFVSGSSTGSVLGSIETNKAVIWIDRELKLPVQIEFYDSNHLLLERHRFKDIRINQKLGDKLFAL